MKITVVGTGYVGLVSGVCFAEIGNTVICVDKELEKIQLLNQGTIPIFEPGLQEVMVRNVEQQRLSFTDRLGESVKEADIVILAVGTPSLPSGGVDMRAIDAAVSEIARAIKKYTIIIVKSTVPVGTNNAIKRKISEETKQPFDVVSVPEFLREGSALSDTMKPDRIIIGADNDKAATIVARLHEPFNAPVMITDLHSAEMIKYASNAFLATKISFINEIANICEKVGAQVEEVARGMGMDGRIGPQFLKAGIGYGGSCFPKDTKALIQIAGNAEYDFKLLKSVVEVNQMQRQAVITKLEQALAGDLSGKTIALWGLAFKPNTDDVRESPAIDIAIRLLQQGAKLKVYDPVAMSKFRDLPDIEHERIYYAHSEWDAAADSDALCLLTEWEIFKQADLQKLQQTMKHSVVIDGRNVLDIDQIRQLGILYYPIGRPPLSIN